MKSEAEIAAEKYAGLSGLDPTFNTYSEAFRRMKEGERGFLAGVNFVLKFAEENANHMDVGRYKEHCELFVSLDKLKSLKEAK